MNYVTTIDTSADLATTWRAVTDVESWPQWTASMTSVTLLGDAGLTTGARARVKQPKLPTTIWQVSELRDGEEFTWVAHSPGVRTAGRHLLSRNPDGTTRITLEIDQRGPLAGLVGALLGGLTRRYLDLEAKGLKAASLATGSST